MDAPSLKPLRGTWSLEGRKGLGTAYPGLRPAWAELIAGLTLGYKQVTRSSP